MLRNILIISITIFLSKWVFAFYFNQNELLITKLIFDLQDWQYFPLIFNLSNFDFTPSYSGLIENLSFITIPIYSTIFHAIFFKIFGLISFFIIEALFIFIALLILFKIFKEFNLENHNAIFLTILIFCIPSIISLTGLGNHIIHLRAIESFFSLRIPKPLITQIYFFLFIFTILKLEKLEKINKKNLIFISFLFSAMWGSFYYNLTLSGLVFIVFYFKKFKQNLFKNYSYHLQNFLILIFFFILFSLPLIFILTKSEPDYLVRVGLFNLNLEKKVVILEHIFNKIFSLKFITVFILNTLMYKYLIFKAKFNNNAIKLFYIIFVSSILSPVIFIMLSPSGSEMYNFMNLLTSITLITFVIFLFLLLISFSNKNWLNKKIVNLLIIIIITSYTFDNYSKLKKSSLNEKRGQFNEMKIEFQKMKLEKNARILTLDGFVMTNLILNEYDNLPIILGVFTSKSDERMENEIISFFKYIDASENDFVNFFKNEKRGWRYINTNVAEFLGYLKYQANSLITFNNSNNFTLEELNFIKESSPFYTQQLILPIDEFKRLSNKFLKYEKPIFNDPDLMIINSEKINLSNFNVNYDVFCLKKINRLYSFYMNKKLNLCN
tara:strand:+ start:2181 stop:4007 length:1827 start_codon:yes stop_codon:yes gene_type:complete